MASKKVSTIVWVVVGGAAALAIYEFFLKPKQAAAAVPGAAATSPASLLSSGLTAIKNLISPPPAAIPANQQQSLAANPAPADTQNISVASSYSSLPSTAPVLPTAAVDPGLTADPSDGLPSVLPTTAPALQLADPTMSGVKKKILSSSSFGSIVGLVKMGAYNYTSIGQLLASGKVLTSAQVSQILNDPTDFIPFTGQLTGTVLAPPSQLDRRYQLGNIKGIPWYQVTAAMDPTYIIDAVYPPDLPLLQLTPEGRLNWYYMPAAGELGASFVTAAAWLQHYNFDGTATGSPNGAWQPTTSTQALYWMYTYIQYYLNKFLKTPYDITALIPYGYNYYDQWRLNYSTPSKIITYLENLNYLIEPVGKKTFWDDVLNAAPLIIAGIVTIASFGIGTPALAAALAGVALKYGQAQVNKIAAEGAAIQAGAEMSNEAANVNTDAENQVVEQGNISDFWQQYGAWIIAAGIGIVIIEL
jgi:hypothetical protein